MVKVALFVRLEAKPGKEAEVEAFLKGDRREKTGNDRMVRHSPWSDDVWHFRCFPGRGGPPGASFRASRRGAHGEGTRTFGNAPGHRKGRRSGKQASQKSAGIFEQAFWLGSRAAASDSKLRQGARSIASPSPAYPATFEKSATPCIALRNSFRRRRRLNRSLGSPAFTVTFSKKRSTGGRSEDKDSIASSKGVCPANSGWPIRSLA